MVNLPTIETLISQIGSSPSAHVIKNDIKSGADYKIDWFFGDSSQFGAHPSYDGYRSVEVKITDLDGDEYFAVFFDHEEDGLYTFAGVIG